MRCTSDVTNCTTFEEGERFERTYDGWDGAKNVTSSARKVASLPDIEEDVKTKMLSEKREEYMFGVVYLRGLSGIGTASEIES